MKRTSLFRCFSSEVESNLFQVLRNGALPTLSDMEVLKRQCGENTQNVDICAVSKSKCRHGYSQSYVYHPVNKKSGFVTSGMVRLTCPHLVKSIDDYEKEGAVRKFNLEVVNKPKMQKTLFEAQEAWQNLKQILITDEQKQQIHDTLGDASHNFFTSGLIGISENKFDDVKCLHAQLGDELMRGSNEIGKEVRRHLELRGVDVTGNDTCFHQCNPDIPVETAKRVWWYRSIKNKSKLQLHKERRRETKQMKTLKAPADKVIDPSTRIAVS